MVADFALASSSSPKYGILSFVNSALMLIWNYRFAATFFSTSIAAGKFLSYLFLPRKVSLATDERNFHKLNALNRFNTKYQPNALLIRRWKRKKSALGVFLFTFRSSSAFTIHRFGFSAYVQLKYPMHHDRCFHATSYLFPMDIHTYTQAYTLCLHVLVRLLRCVCSSVYVSVWICSHCA